MGGLNKEKVFLLQGLQVKRGRIFHRNHYFQEKGIV